MLNQRKDILAAQPTILQIMANDDWHLIAKITQTNSQTFECECIKKSNEDFDYYQRIINEVPFHIADDIWVGSLVPERDPRLGESLRFENF